MVKGKTFGSFPCRFLFTILYRTTPSVFPLVLAAALTVPLPPHAAKLVVAADRQQVQAGEIVQITWSATGAEEVLLEPLGQHLPAQGRTILRPETTTTYWFSVVNLAGGETRPLTITVIGGSPAPAQPAPAPVEASVQAPAPGAIQAWVQVLATTKREDAQRLLEELSQRCPERPVMLEVPNHSGPGTLFRVRFGPYESAKEARQHLKSLGPHLKVPGSTAFVTVR